MSVRFGIGTVLTAILVSGFASAAHAEAASAAGPFAAMHGAWSGGGSYTSSFGEREALRCRATYQTGSGGHTLQFTLRCASQGTNIVLGGNVQHRAGAVFGTWSESTRGVNGRVDGRAQGNRIVVRASSDFFAASLALTTRDNKQAILIRPEGGQFGVVSVSLSKGR